MEAVKKAFFLNSAIKIPVGLFVHADNTHACYVYHAVFILSPLLVQLQIKVPVIFVLNKTKGILL